ncbi:hypothetical protein CLLI_22150 [Clostridium liquoris]|jgi:predicted HicB family RNase H-like nuclease|uniref:Uncharacterized protein n=1 Tax=Clostridium liquoris TaxID=1289519 RepID=A0A2T0B1I0_9CLOT|nr:hypothetical protein [Clostridium liquoris]PRR77651.1 hypothetical protein CLLI_22150 [Clostridium liquoris]
MSNLEKNQNKKEVAQEPLIKKYTLTIPDGLLKEIKGKANQQGMSVNAYILLSISQTLKEK